jgi:hypothetical protein
VNPQEDVLRQILRARAILDRTGDQGEHQVFVPVDQLLEGALVAASAALDELALVHGLHQPLVLEHAGTANVSAAA